MGHLPFTVGAYFLNSISVLIDKYQITKNLPSPLLYVFYISAFSLLTLLALPLTHFPLLQVWLFGSLATVLWTTGAYCMFSALKIGQATRVIPVIGVLTPSFLLIWGTVSGIVNLNQMWAVFLLVIGLLILVVRDLRGRLSFKEGMFELITSLLFAISYTLLHEAYIQQDFLTVFIWSKLVLIPIGLIILAIPLTRKIVLPGKTTHEENHKPIWKSKIGLLFLVGQACGGGSEMLLQYSVSLATPALVNSLQGIQYAFLFLFGIILSRKFPKIYGEHYSPLIIGMKILGILIIASGLYLLAISEAKQAEKVALGVTFSPRFATELGLDPQEAYLKSLNAIKFTHLRFPVYWDEVEKEEGNYDFSEAAFYLDEAKRRQIKVILVVGQKQPRWPECFVPDWAEGLTREQRYQRVIRLVTKEISYFKKYDNIISWQVENEAMFHFGLCEKPDNLTWELLQNEVAVVRTMDSSRPITITDSGELSSWKYALKLGDQFGTTMYRSSWNPVLGYLEYPTPPLLYPLKAQIMQKLLRTNDKTKIIAELQAEPWAKGTSRIIDMPIEEQIAGMSPAKLEENIAFARDTGFSPIYLWGVEWWYWMSINGHPEYLQTVAKVVQTLDPS